MFRLGSLFKRQTHDPAPAPAAPMPSHVEPTGPDVLEQARAHSVAPGTHISYSPDLIDKLRADHAELLNVFMAIQASTTAGDLQQASAKLGEFRRALQAHLLTENVRLYVYLEHMLATDKLSHDLMHDFRSDMADIGKAVIDFLNKYRDLAVRPDLAESFPAELATVGAVLTERIQREEDTLYPLYIPA